MKKINKHINLILLFLLYFTTPLMHSQEVTEVYGVVKDAKTKEPLPFVTIYFVGKNIGTTTDFNGEYKLDSQWASNKLGASFVGYKKQVKVIKRGTSQKIDFYLEPDSEKLDEVVIKIKYRNKNNPAVELIKKVIKNKDKNRKEALDYYQFDKHKKVEFDISNITEDFRKKKIFKKLQFIFKYVDTSKVNGKPYLPVFLEETLSTEYFRKNPKDRKEIIKARKITGFHDYINDQGVGFITDYIYSDINIYDGNVMLMTNQFVSPIAKISPIVYKFQIIDTLDVKGKSCIQLGFRPRNKQDFAFKGNLYITNDDNYAVVKAIMNVTKDINLNFVNDLQIIQEFEFVDNKIWMKTKDEIFVDISFLKRKTGFFGKKKVIYSNFKLNKPIDDKIFNGIEKEVELDQATNRDESYWKKERLEPLTEEEANIYSMVDTIKTLPAFKRTINTIMLITVGYWNFNKVDVGPVNSFYSFNDIEGFRFRFGGKTSEKLSKTKRLEGYFVYATKDKKLKYSIKASFSLNKKSLRKFPKNYLGIMYQKETNFPGMQVQFINEDNFLLSFKRGVSDKILYYDVFKINHKKDWGSGFSTNLELKYLKESPGGNWQFNFTDYIKKDITSSQIITTFRFAPNEKFYEGMDYTIPIINKYPIFQLTYLHSFKGVLGSDYEYDKLKFNFFKRFYFGPVGFTNFDFEAGKVYGDGIPYTNLFIPRANQTYSYQLYSYNLMNFMEFVSDKYVAGSVEHHFYGFIFNRIPLMKKLKWRAVASAKALYGSLSDSNDPQIHPELMQFPSDLNGVPYTYTFTNSPYVETSIGVENIFKFFRVDILRRVNYLNLPNVSKYGVRARFKFDF